MRDSLEYRKSQNKKYKGLKITMKNCYTVTCSVVNCNTGAEASVKIWICKSSKTQL